MITKFELVKGTTLELAEYFDKLTETTRSHMTDRNMLNCKDGFLQQLDRIPTQISLLFYLDFKEDVKDVELKQIYVHIEDKGK